MFYFKSVLEKRTIGLENLFKAFKNQYILNLPLIIYKFKSILLSL